MASPDERSAVLVAGGTGALGRAVVTHLLDVGRQVVVTWIKEDERERMEADLGSRDLLELVEADLSDPHGAEAAVGAAGQALGAVVNLVGGYAGGHKVGEADPDELDRMVAVNLRPLFLLARAAMPALADAGGGAFVGVSARNALEPRGGDAAYSAAKAAVINLIRSIAVEYRDAGVRANAILPSAIDTPATRASMPKADHSRWVPPEEIARVVGFLVSADSAPTSGAAIPVYGRA